ncbi:MAG: hypothetical protein JWL64_2360 [Frankiales bacterium]|nr:hypothetical protein [Frankiales bacterium]
MEFSRAGERIELQIAPEESELVRSLAGDLIELLDTGVAPEPADPDPLAQLVGLPATDPVRPTDPALARLFPDGYADDEEAAADFRRYTEGDLRRGKKSAADVVRTTAPAEGGVVELDREQADAWLGWLNDVRLVVATRLGVTQDDPLEDVSQDDPRFPAYLTYHFLSVWQVDLIQALDGGPGEPY